MPLEAPTDMLKLIRSLVRPAGPSPEPRRARPDPARAATRTDAARPAKTDWAALRSPERPTDKSPTPLTLEWAASLPAHVRPLNLLSSYPRVANRLALCWNDPVLTDRLFGDLLMDKRVGRQGFPIPVAMELKRLNDHFHSNHAIADGHNPWDVHSQAIGDR